MTIDGALRSFPQLSKFCCRFKFPKWEIATDLDPEDLKGLEATRDREERKAAKERQVASEVQLKEQLVLKMVKPMTQDQIMSEGESAGISWSRNTSLEWIRSMCRAGILVCSRERRGSIAAEYTKAPKNTITQKETIKTNDTKNPNNENSQIDGSGEVLPI